MANSPNPPRSVVITGASSGIGEGLALAYAAPGVHLALTGRNPRRLEGVAQAAGTRGATVTAACIDVADRQAMENWLRAVDAANPVELLIANAGISGGTGGRGEDAEQTRQIFAVNINGVVNTVLPLIPRMTARRQGQIGIMASLAGFRGMPAAPAYCASKAAVRIWGEGLRGELAADNVGVSVICPGFVRSRITDTNDFPMPFFMETGRAVGIIQKGLAANKSRIAFPGPMAATVWLLAALPAAWTDRLLRLSPRKRSHDTPPD